MTTVIKCCNDPSVRGGKCYNCGTWADEVDERDTASDLLRRKLLGRATRVLDHGYVALIDFMGDDASIIEAARMSTGRGFFSWEPYRRCKTCDLYEPEASYPSMLCTPSKSDGSEHPGPIKTHEWEKYPNGDMGLLDTLWRKKHATPFEMCEMVIEVSAPIFVFREWHRHRTQCLAGDTRLHFDLPGGIERRGTQKYTMTIKEVFEKFQPTERSSRPERQTNALGSRQRIQAMRLRCVNEETKEVTHTSIVDVWESGTKKVYEVSVYGVGTIRCSIDHRFFTPAGWKTLKEIIDDARPHAMTMLERDGVLPLLEDSYRATVFCVQSVANESISFEVPAVETEEAWRPVLGWEDFYEVSNMGRVRRIAGGQGVRTQGTCKKLTPNMAGYLCTNLNRPGKQEQAAIHTLVLEAFVGPCPDGMECRHLDGNQKNNWLSNLKWGTPQENGEDRSRHGRTPSLKTVAGNITSVNYVGEEMTYDIEVADPWHNFVAEGFVVHNSYNEFSARYSVMPNLHYVPSAERLKAVRSENKQATGIDAHLGEEVTEDELDLLAQNIKQDQEGLYERYEDLLRENVPKEIARINTPVSRYSKMRAKCSLRNWLGFLNLRMRPDAQWEIRQYAQEIANLIKEIYPNTWGLFEEYDLYGAHLSRTELRAVRAMLTDKEDTFSAACQAVGLSGSKVREFKAKLRRGGEEIL